MMDLSIKKAVSHSLQEDIQTGDITAQLISPDKEVNAYVVTREEAVICGQAWFNEVFAQLDKNIQIDWFVKEGQNVCANTKLVSLHGLARNILTGERTALNWLQTLSGTATLVSRYVALLEGTKTQLLDTRKTIPNLRYAQKYAVRCGGGHNHRLGLFDAYLIKENHILSCGSIEKAIDAARAKKDNKKIEVEVENIEQLEEAIHAKADVVMLDNFHMAGLEQAVQVNNGRVKLEVSGNVSLENLREIAETGVDYISVGAITKHLQAIDLSMRFE